MRSNNLALVFMFSVLFCLWGCSCQTNIESTPKKNIKATPAKLKMLPIELVSCSTGNTCLVNIKGEEGILSKKVAILIEGYMSPNPSSYCDAERERGAKAKTFLEEKLRNTESAFLVNARKRRGSSFIIGKLLLDGKDVSIWMIKNGLGSPVGLEVNWCEESRRKVEI